MFLQILRKTLIPIFPVSNQFGFESSHDRNLNIRLKELNKYKESRCESNLKLSLEARPTIKNSFNARESSLKFGRSRGGLLERVAYSKS